MSEFQLQPATETHDEVPDKAALLKRLDELLEQYLNALDEYQKAQQMLTDNFANGFLSLAQANFSNPSRTRYGPDHYDERMQASRTTSLTAEKEKIAFAASFSKIAQFGPNGAEGRGQANSERATSDSEAPSAEPASFPGSDPENDEAVTEGKASGDPLRWFGILVPPALRSAQSSFVSAVEGPIPRLATLARDLKGQEVNIARLRKQIRKI